VSKKFRRGNNIAKSIAHRAYGFRHRAKRMG
jgi:hypothetical protein